MFSYFEPNFIEKYSFGKVVFQSKMMRNKNRSFGRHFETVQHLKIVFFRIMIFYSTYIYGANVISKSQWESGFLIGGSMGPPRAPTGVKVLWSLKC